MCCDKVGLLATTSSFSDDEDFTFQEQQQQQQKTVKQGIEKCGNTGT